VKKDEMNLDILLRLIEVLKNIEDGNIDQHTGAFEVGKILKAMYIDSALLKADKFDKAGAKMEVKETVVTNNISWKDFKAMPKLSNIL